MYMVLRVYRGFRVNFDDLCDQYGSSVIRYYHITNYYVLNTSTYIIIIM